VDRQARAHAGHGSHDQSASEHERGLVASTTRYTSAGPKPPVARDATSPPPPSASDRAFADADVLPYLAAHRELAWRSLAEQLVATPWRLPHPLEWRERGLFVQQLVYALHGAIDLGKPNDVHALVEHASQLAMLARVLPADGAWSPGVGALFAQLVVGAVGWTIERVARRYLASVPLEGAGPLDRAVASAIAIAPVLHDPADTAARELVAAKNDTDHVTARWRFLNTLDRVDDPETRARMKARFRALAGEELEYFIQHAEWYGKRDKEQAFALISSARSDAEKALAALPPDERAALELQAIDWAKEIVTQSPTDVDAKQIAHVLGSRTPLQIEAIRAAVRKLDHGKHSLYERLDRALSGGDADEAVGALAGDPVDSAQRGVVNAGRDVARIREILRGLDEKTYAAWRDRHAEAMRARLVLVPAGPEREELRALVDGDLRAADRARVEYLLADPKDGVQLGDIERSKRLLADRSPEQVIAELERMKPEDLASASAGIEWGRDRFDGPTRQRIELLLAGKRIEAKRVALHAAIERRDQQAIEDALSNTSPEERAYLAGEAQRLRAYYAAAGTTSDGSAVGDTRARVEKDNAYVDEIAATELRETGELSMATRIYRARGDLQEKARLLEGIPSNRRLYEIGFEYAQKYRGAMLPAPQVGPPKAQSDAYELRELLDANELRIDNVRRYGVLAEREPWLQQRIQDELYRRQHSGALEIDEQIRKAKGGAIGSQETARNIGAAQDDELAPAIGASPRELAPGVSNAEFARVDAARTKALEVQRDEKQKLAAAWASAWKTLFKIAAAVTGNPLVFLYVDALANLSAMAWQWHIAGEAYDANGDAVHAAIDLVVDGATVGISEVAQLGRGAKVVAIAGAQTIGAGVGALADGRSAGAIFEEAAQAGTLALVPGAVGLRVQKMFGGARARLAEVAVVGALTHGDLGAMAGQGVSPGHGGVRHVALDELHGAHAYFEARGARVSAVRYNDEAHALEFEHDGTVVRAALAPRITSAAELTSAGNANRIVGHPVDAATGHAILRAAAAEDLSAFAPLGFAHVALPPGVEVGLGALPDGRVVVVRGGYTEVDWAGLPGVTPLAHTHPAIPGTDLLADAHGARAIALAEAGRATDKPLRNREVLYPSASDFALVARLHVPEHVVYTPFVVGDDTFARRPTPGETRPRLSYRIIGAREIGTVDGRAAFHAVVEGWTDRLEFRRDVWVVEVEPDGHLYMEEPAGLARPHERSSAATPPEQLRERERELAAVVRAELGDHARVPVHVLDRDDFIQRFRSDRGRAVFAAGDAGPAIYARSDATDGDIVAETYHARQLADPQRAPDVRALYRNDFTGWDRMSASDRIAIVRDKLALEIDAHERMHHDGVVGAAEDLVELRRRVAELDAITGDQLAAFNAQLAPMPDYLRDPPYLFAKGPRIGARPPILETPPPGTMPVPKTGAERSGAYGRDDVVVVRHLGVEWTENGTIESGYAGIVTIEPGAKTGAVDVVVTTTGGRHVYHLEPGATVLVKTGDSIARRARIAEERARRYRAVEIERADGRKQVVEEIRLGEDAGWQLRGTESTRRGDLAEEAARLQLDERLDAEKRAAHERGEYYEWVRIPHHRGGGGFDDVVVVFTGTKENPVARVIVREVKNYPGRYVPRAEFTAIGENLEENLRTFRESIEKKIEAASAGEQIVSEGRSISRGQLEAVREALERSDLAIEVVIGPETHLGSELHHGSSVLGELRARVRSVVKKDVLVTRGGEAERLEQRWLDTAKKKKETEP
jgi:hypothetical protein